MFHVIAFLLVLCCWVAFGVVFFVFLRGKPAQGAERTRDVRSRVGIVLQALSYVVVWSASRRFKPLVGFSRAFDVGLLGLAVVLAVGSIWLVTAAVRTLGKEWSLTARLVEGHRLVMDGPYALVRHPIYTGMFGLLLATGLTHSYGPALLVGLLVFWMGTVVRVRSEERLLRAAFGAQYEAYARRVPAAVVPGLY
ncbi:MAG TPA: isoprenylcysteine carboxylmethyltransferase family protein [Pyrinomonadaceae bacterium]|jgi:protein-S-isoprenylcysteine O-methyltransferase Ste14